MTMDVQTRTDIVTEALRLAPPAAVGGLTIAGVTLSDLVLLVTLVYTVLALGFMLHKWYRFIFKPDQGRKE
jgi:hypothetical protein